MKYGESAFDVIYLLFAFAGGIWILRRRRDTIGRLMGSAVLVLGGGDAFHLIPRVINHFGSGDCTAWLGFGKLVTSLTMTAFYVLLYWLWLRAYGEPKNRKLSLAVYALALVRVVLCLLPQNRWLEGGGSVLWGVIRNIPFVALGCADVWLFWRKRAEIRCFRPVWLLITLSFLFYIPVAVGVSLVPTLGMLMLPKTICYMLLIVCFLKYASAEKEAP